MVDEDANFQTLAIDSRDFVHQVGGRREISACSKNSAVGEEQGQTRHSSARCQMRWIMENGAHLKDIDTLKRGGDRRFGRSKKTAIVDVPVFEVAVRDSESWAIDVR